MPTEFEPTTPPSSPEENQPVDPEFVLQAFNAVLEHLKTHDPHRKPVRPQRIFEAFKGRENELVCISDLSEPFSETTADPEPQFRNAVSWINHLFSELDIDLEITRVTTYRLNRPSSK